MPSPHVVGIILLASAITSFGQNATQPAVTQMSRVTLARESDAYVLSNGIVVARVSRESGNLVSLQYKGIECLAGEARHSGGYWSHAPAAGHVIDTITLDPQANGGDRAEVSVKGDYTGTPLGHGPGGSAAVDIEIRYALGLGESGLHTYCIFTHKPDYPATSIGEAQLRAQARADRF